jgi:hypothetical protein
MPEAFWILIAALVLAPNFRELPAFESFKIGVQQVNFSHAWPQKAPTIKLQSTARRVPQNT